MKKNNTSLGGVKHRQEILDSLFLEIDSIKAIQMGIIINFEDEEGNRIDPNIARATAFGIGTLNAGIELAQLRTLLKTIPGADKVFSSAIMKTAASKAMKSKLLTLAGAYSGTVATETGQEVAQESVNIVFEELSKKLIDRAEEE